MRAGASARAYPDEVIAPGAFRDFEEWPNAPPTSATWDGKPAKKIPVEDRELFRSQPDYEFLLHYNEQRAEIAYYLLKSMREHGGIGLAANQLGLCYRVFVLATNIPMVCFNPRIVDFDEKTDRLAEGCLSYPDLSVKVARSTKIRVRYQDIIGEVKSKTLEGLAARVFQHELDHLNGVTFFEKAHPHHKEKARKQWAILKRRLKKK